MHDYTFMVLCEYVKGVCLFEWYDSVDVSCVDFILWSAFNEVIPMACVDHAGAWHEVEWSRNAMFQKIDFTLVAAVGVWALAEEFGQSIRTDRDEASECPIRSCFVHFGPVPASAEWESGTVV